MGCGTSDEFTGYRKVEEREHTSADYGRAHLLPRGIGDITKTAILGAFSVPLCAQVMLLAPGATEGAPSPECTIKGNVNRNGERVYHMQDQKFYARIRMDMGGGKRWFCNPEEAEAAGWRRALR